MYPASKGKRCGVLDPCHATILARGTATIGPRLISLDIYAATITTDAASTIALREHARLTSATADELVNLDWAEADIPCLPAVAAWLRSIQPQP